MVKNSAEALTYTSVDCSVAWPAERREVADIFVPEDVRVPAMVHVQVAISVATPASVLVPSEGFLPQFMPPWRLQVDRVS